MLIHFLPAAVTEPVLNALLVYMYTNIHHAEVDYAVLGVSADRCPCVALSISFFSQCDTSIESMTICTRCDTTQGITAKPTAPPICGASPFKTVTAIGSVFWLPTRIQALLIAVPAA